MIRARQGGPLMDNANRDALTEFMELFVQNWTGNAVEAAMRARALQDISKLDTKALLQLASQTSLQAAPKGSSNH